MAVTAGEKAGAAGREASAFKPFVQYFEPSNLAELPLSIRQSLDPIELSLSASNSGPPMLRATAAWTGSWWFTMMDGRGVAQVRGDRARMSADYILMVLTLSGQNRPSGTIRSLPRPGEVILMPWTADGGLISAGEFKYLFVFIPKVDLIRAGYEDIESLFGRPISVLAGAGAVLSSALRTLVNQASRPSSRPDAAKALPAITRLILDVFVTGDPLQFHPSAPDDRVDHIIEYLEDHLSLRGLTAEHAAMACGLSKRQLFRCFATANLNFADTLRNLRLERAQELLAFRPNLSVEEVALSTGFGSSGHFCRVFRGAVGTTPLNYRRRQRSYQSQ